MFGALCEELDVNPAELNQVDLDRLIQEAIDMQDTPQGILLRRAHRFNRAYRDLPRLNETSRTLLDNGFGYLHRTIRRDLRLIDELSREDLLDWHSRRHHYDLSPFEKEQFLLDEQLE